MTPGDSRHGTTAGHHAHTAAGEPSCGRCKFAHKTYQAYVRRQRAYGRWQPFVDADQARTHVLGLRAGGTSILRIATQAGVAPSRISYLLYGCGEKPMPAKIRRRFADALLKVTPEPRLVSSLGVHRRLTALIALGYSQGCIGGRLGVTQTRVWQLIHHRSAHVEQETHDRVDSLYESLSMTSPPVSTGREKGTATRARRVAAANGWAPPLAWDNIDDPKESPTGFAGAEKRRPPGDVDKAVVERVWCGDTNVAKRTTRAEKQEVMSRWLAAGGSEKSLCARFGWRPGRYKPPDNHQADVA